MISYADEEGIGYNAYLIRGSEIDNFDDDVVINGSNNRDEIYNYNNRVTINCFGGDDYVLSQSSSAVLIYGGEGNDNISNNSSGGFTDGGNGNDQLDNRGANSTVLGGYGNDNIHNYGKNANVNGGAGNDTVQSFYCSSVTINGGDDDDYLDSISDKAVILGGSGNDYVYSSGNNTTIEPGSGNDRIFLQNAVLMFNFEGYTLDLSTGRCLVRYSAGNDTIINISELITLSFAENCFNNASEDGNDVVLNCNTGSVRLIDGVGKQINLLIGNDLSTLAFPTTVHGTSGDDSITNSNAFSLVEAAGGNDTVTNNTKIVTIDGGAGNDVIKNNTIGNQTSILGGDGNDFIADRVRMSGATINGGRGDDIISLKGGVEVISYAAGDGNDTVYAFNDKTRLAFDYDSIVQSGNDVVMKIGSGSITFKDTSIDLFGVNNNQIVANDELSSILEPKILTELGDLDKTFTLEPLKFDKMIAAATKNKTIERRNAL